MPEDREENVKVAVRVRPFNKREQDRKSKMCIQMVGNKTTVTDPNSEKNKSFTYDFSYWSFDGCKEESNGYFAPDPSHPNGSKYCDQKRVYEDLGKGIIKNAWQGYNATLFAYGQTGSGKSWSVIGYGENKGIVPMVCEELFEGIKANTEDKQFEVKLSMLEIYNEVVRDLLSKSQSKHGLKIRQHPKKGFYAENLSQPIVTSHEDIASKMNEGTVNRTVRSTNMNATSSRAHTIVCVILTQKYKNARGQETAKSSVINLVDLAGSERVESTGATGDRLKEGAAINMSLSCLGNCINALVKRGQGEKVRIPFRDSSLTKLLKNALGGNSKTVMIAAISPADINFDETVSTLNFADRAKQIKTKAVVNEDPTEKLIRDLKEENDRLKLMIETGKFEPTFIDEDGDGVDDRDGKQKEEAAKAQVLSNEQEMQNLIRTYEEKLKEAKKGSGDPLLKKKEEEKQRKPHIFNLNSDPQLSGKIIHILRAGTNTIGNRRGDTSDIVMIGPSMQENHAVITVDQKGVVKLKPHNNDCRVLINGNPINCETELQSKDRLMFGSTQIWLYSNPLQKSKSGNKNIPAVITYEFAQEEIASKSGIDFKNLSSETDVGFLQQELQELVPAVEEANSISADLDKKAKFEIVMISPQMMGKTEGKTEFNVKLRNLENGTEYLWAKHKFMDRLYKMREMYNNYEEEAYGDDWDDDENDPFYESIDTEVHIGNVQFIIQPLAHMVELKESLDILSIKGSEVGVLNVEVVPCNKSGKEYSEKDDVFVDNPDDLIGRDLYFKIKIMGARGLPNRYSEVYCTYKFYLDEEEHKTKPVTDTTNPNFKYEKKFTYKPVTKQFIDYLMKESLVIKVKGKQRVRRSAIPASLQGLSTRDMLKNDRTVFSKTATLMNGFNMNGRVVDPQKQSIIVELLLMKKTQARLQQRCDNVSKLVKEAENTSKINISTTLLREVMNANSPEQADAIIRKKLAENPDSFMNGKRGRGNTAKSSVCSIL